ncbi:PHD/YefM family antitoxin component YafN of YafNO toxin-antitoxin module [Mucilaginibacter sp. UYNi724]
MLTVHPQYLKDSNGDNSLVVLPVSEFNSIIEELEELEDVRLFDEAAKDDTGEPILFSEYLKSRKKDNA